MKEEYLSMETVNKLAELEHIKEKMNKQVKIEIDNKECYCDNEIFKYIMRLQDKVELLEYNRDKTIEYIEKNKQIDMFADLRKDGTHQYTIECDADDLLDRLRGDSNE